MNNGKHSYLMIGLVAAGAVLFLTGSPGGLLFLLWPLACMAMMVWMMWRMGDTGRGTAEPAEHTHDDGLSHAHK